MSRVLGRRTDRGPDDEGVNLSPLIDMTFLLLIFFAVTSTFVRDAAVDITRPSAQTAAAIEATAVRVQLDARGAIWVETQPTDRWMVQRRVRDQLRALESDRVLVIADASVAAQRLVEVVDQCRLAGADSVAVAAEAVP